MLLKTISAKHSKVTKLIQASVKMTQYMKCFLTTTEILHPPIVPHHSWYILEMTLHRITKFQRY